MASNDVKEMRKLLAPFLDLSSKEDQQRRSLAILLLRMYTDLDKSVRRCDEHGQRSKWVARVGSAATAAASAVAGTALVSGSVGRVAIVVGIVAAALGVLGSVVAALRLNDSIKQNKSDHAQYLPLLRQLGTYAAAELPTANIQDIRKQLDDFAISAVEAKEAAT